MTDDSFSKPYRLIFCYHPEFLEARVFGPEDSIEISCGYWEEIAAEVRRGEFDKVLVVEKLGSNVGISDAFEITCRHALLDFRHAKIAFVDEYEDHGAINHFCETVASNRGHYVRVCDSVEDARNWLLDEK